MQTLTLVGYTCRAPKYDSGGDVRHARSRRREAARHVLVARYPPLVRSGRRDAIPGRLLTSTGRSATSGQVYAWASVNGEIKRFFRDKRWQAGVRLADQELLRVCKLRARRRSPGRSVAPRCACPAADPRAAGLLIGQSS